MLLTAKRKSDNPGAAKRVRKGHNLNVWVTDSQGQGPAGPDRYMLSWLSGFLTALACRINKWLPWPGYSAPPPARPSRPPGAKRGAGAGSRTRTAERGRGNV
jgi:hypothetical protein